MAPSPSDVRRLTAAQRAAQVKRAAKVAAIVAGLYRSRVRFDSPDSLESWLNLVVPKILEGHNDSAILGAQYGNAMRSLELPDLRDGFRYEPIISVTEPQLRTSLSVVGPARQAKKVAEIRERDISDTSKKALEREAKQEAETAVAAATLRHVQNGGRRSVEGGMRDDERAIGYVRVTRANPCYFCAMLASRGLEQPNQYREDSFARSDARFVGPGDAKVHDRCQCCLKTVYRLDDEILLDNRTFEAMWYDLSPGDADPLTNFRRNYEHRGTTKSA